MALTRPGVLQRSAVGIAGADLCPLALCEVQHALDWVIISRGIVVQAYRLQAEVMIGQQYRQLVYERQRPQVGAGDRCQLRAAFGKAGTVDNQVTVVRWSLDGVHHDVGKVCIGLLRHDPILTSQSAARAGQMNQCLLVIETAKVANQLRHGDTAQAVQSALLAHLSTGIHGFRGVVDFDVHRRAGQRFAAPFRIFVAHDRLAADGVERIHTHRIACRLLKVGHAHDRHVWYGLAFQFGLCIGLLGSIAGKVFDHTCECHGFCKKGGAEYLAG